MFINLINSINCHISIARKKLLTFYLPSRSNIIFHNFMHLKRSLHTKFKTPRTVHFAGKAYIPIIRTSITMTIKVS